MGKESLIKSTSKKAAPKKTKTAKKSSSKSKSGAKAASQQPKTTKSAKTEAKKASAEKAKKAPTLQDLLFKKFAAYPASSKSTAVAPDFSNMTAPPLIDADDPKEAERLRGLLALKFSMAEIKAVAKPPIEIKASAEAPAKPAPKPEDSKPEAPKAEEPKTEEPKPEPPKAEEPKAEEPKPEPPKAEAPKMEEPKPEPPKAIPTPPVVVKPQPTVTQAVDSPQTSSASSDEPEESFTDPVLRSAKIGLAAITALFLIILWASFNNSSKYFVVPKKGSIEIWHGEFSPTGRAFFAVLHGLQSAEPVQEAYSKKEIFPVIFNYYLEKSDDLLDVSDLPDYKSIVDYLEKADSFALDAEMRDAVAKRVSNIQRLTLLYKADIDSGKGTIESLTAAMDSLRQAQRLTKDPAQAEVIGQRIESLMARKVALEEETEAGSSPEQESPESKDQEAVPTEE